MKKVCVRPQVMDTLGAKDWVWRAKRYRKVEETRREIKTRGTIKNFNNEQYCIIILTRYWEGILEGIGLRGLNNFVSCELGIECKTK